MYKGPLIHSLLCSEFVELTFIIYSASKMSLTGAKTDLRNGLPDQLPHTTTQNETAL